MKTGRSIIVSVILALGAAGSILAGSAAVPAAAAAPAAITVAAAPSTWYHT